MPTLSDTSFSTTLALVGVVVVVAALLSGPIERWRFPQVALFLLLGMLYDRRHTYDVDKYRGLWKVMPVLGGFFCAAAFASIGLPGFSGFIGEFLVMQGLFQVNTWVAALVCTGIILGAAYMLWLYRRIIFGELVKDELKSILDLNMREKVVFAPLVLLVLWMGIYPSSFTNVMASSVDKLVEDYHNDLRVAGMQPDVTGVTLLSGWFTQE